MILLDGNYWGMDRGAWKDNNPLGLDAENFILDNCQYVLYLRKDPRFHCVDHWDLATQSAKPTIAHCTTCWGLGNKIDPIIVPARITLGPAKVSPKVSDLRTDLGYMEYYESAIDLPRAVCPSLEDLVAVCEWDTPAQNISHAKKPKVVRVSTVYSIKQINDYFERELSWFGCGMEAAELDRVKIVRAVPYIRNLEVLNTITSWSQNTYW